MNSFKTDYPNSRLHYTNCYLLLDCFQKCLCFLEVFLVIYEKFIDRSKHLGFKSLFEFIVWSWSSFYWMKETVHSSNSIHSFIIFFSSRVVSVEILIGWLIKFGNVCVTGWSRCRSRSGRTATISCTKFTGHSTKDKSCWCYWSIWKVRDTTGVGTWVLSNVKSSLCLNVCWCWNFFVNAYYNQSGYTSAEWLYVGLLMLSFVWQLCVTCYLFRLCWLLLHCRLTGICKPWCFYVSLYHSFSYMKSFVWLFYDSCENVNCCDLFQPVPMNLYTGYILYVHLV